MQDEMFALLRALRDGGQFVPLGPVWEEAGVKRLRWKDDLTPLGLKVIAEEEERRASADVDRRRTDQDRRIALRPGGRREGE